MGGLWILKVPSHMKSPAVVQVFYSRKHKVTQFFVVNSQQWFRFRPSLILRDLSKPWGNINHSVQRLFVESDTGQAAAERGWSTEREGGAAVKEEQETRWPQKSRRYDDKRALF